MATRPTKTTNLLYLDQIRLQHIPNREYTLSIFVGNVERELQRNDNQTWTPVERIDVSPTSKMRVEIQKKSGHSIWAKYRQMSEMIDLQGLFDDYWSCEKHEFTVPMLIVIGKYSWSLELRFSSNATVESVRSLLHNLEGLLREYSPLMTPPIERALNTIIKYGVAFAELNPVTKAVFGVASATFELLREQNKYDQIPSGIFNRLQRILPVAERVVDEIVCEETKDLEEVVPRMFEVMQRVAQFSCDYIKHGRFARIGGGLAHPEVIEEMERELAKVIEDFELAVNVEALRSTKAAEQELLLGRLKSVEAGYDLDQCCMKGTRASILDRIVAWVANPQERNDGNTYWFHGSPGIGKTSLAHSICENLHRRKHLAGAFFCRRDDPHLSELRNILPALINALAGSFPPFRSLVANRLRNDRNLTSKSMKASLFLDFIRNVPRHPKRPLVFVIDAIDECDNIQSRLGILKVLTDAAAQAPWLKVIITCRPEADIQRFFDSTKSSHLRYDLATDQEAGADLRAFARRQFNLVASKWYIPTPWPDETLFNGIISRANGLFIFIKTFVLGLQHCRNHTVLLKAAMEGSDGAGLNSLFGLYSSILQIRIDPGDAEFQRVIGVLLITAPHHSLSDETLAELAGVTTNLVKTWMDDLSSLLYREKGAKGGIRVRHQSISDFFTSDDCPPGYRVNLRDAHAQLGIACLKTMVGRLRFNICMLEDSRLANADVEDLQTRINQNIPDSLQYSSLYWSDHLCFTNDEDDPCVWGALKEFFEGLYPLFWIEVLSVMGMIPTGAPSLRGVISWSKNSDSNLLERIQDICQFIIAFHTPLSLSAPHTYISTGPFLPSQSPLSSTFGRWFTKTIRMQGGKLLSWPAPPSEWVGHTNPVICMSYSPNGRQIASGSNDRTIRIWDAETGAPVGKPLEGHTDYVRSVAYSPDGCHIVSGSGDKTIRIWDAGTGAAVGKPLQGHTHYVRSVSYSPDGRQIISGSGDGTIRIWDAQTRTAVGRPLVGHQGAVRSVAFSPDGRHIVSGSNDGTCQIWEAQTGAAVGKPLEGHTDHVRSVAYSPLDGRYIISGSRDKTIRIWDAETGATVGRPLEGHAGYVRSVAYSPDGRHIISGSSDKTIRIWDAKTGVIVGKPLAGHADYVRSVAYSPDGQYIISGSSDRTIRIWDAKTGAAFGRTLEGRAHHVRSVAYSPDGRYIVSGSYDSTIRIWDAETGVAIGEPLKGHTDYVRSVAYSPDGRHIVSGSSDKTVRIWDIERGAAIGKPLEGHTHYVRSVAYSPDGRRIISGSYDNTIRIWDAMTGAAVGGPLEGHNHHVRSVAYSPDGRRIISGSSDSTIRIWDAETGAIVGKPIKGHTKSVRSVAYSPDGRYIVSGSNDSTIRIWDANTGAVVGKASEGHVDSVLSVAYSPDGNYIISGSADRTIKIWDAKTGAMVGRPIKGHSDCVWSAPCSPDGQRIASGSNDNTIRVWDLISHTHIQSNPSPADFCAWPGRDGWVRDSIGGLLYWVPPECLTGLHPPALLTIFLASHIQQISLDFSHFVFGTSWTQIFNSEPV